MSVNFVVRPEKILTRRSINTGNLTTASTTFVPVPGTRTIFNLGQDSLFEYLVQGNLTSVGGAAVVSVDVAIDNYLIGLDALQSALPGAVAGPNGATNGLLSVTTAAAAAVSAFQLQDIMDTLGVGPHSFELFFKASANTAEILAAAASNPLKYVLIEHASVYPPYQKSAY